MKKEKQVRSYKRRTKSGKIVTVKAHTAKYDAADEKAKEVSKKPGAGKELEERKKKPAQLEIPFDKEEEKKVLDEVKGEEKESTSKKSAEKKTTKKVRPVGTGTNGPEPKKSSAVKVKNERSKVDSYADKHGLTYEEDGVYSDKKGRNFVLGIKGDKVVKRRINDHLTADSELKISRSKGKKSTKRTKAETSEPAFTAAEFKEWYRGTGSAADKKVAKALRAQLGRSGYRKLEDEAIDNYSSRGHLSMFKRVSGGSSSSAETKSVDAPTKATSKVKSFLKLPKPEKGSKGYAVHMALRSVARVGIATDDSVRDALVRNGYPEDKAYSKGVKEVVALAKKHGLRI